MPDRPDNIKVIKRAHGKTAEVKSLAMERTQASNFQSIYVNNVQISVSYFDVKMLLGEVSAITDGRLNVSDKVAVTMSPEHAASLHKLLGDQLEKYRENFG